MATTTRYALCRDCGESDRLHVHLEDRDDLRRYLDSAYRVDDVEVILASEWVPDFDDAVQAENWLAHHDLEDEIEREHEWFLEHHGRGGRI